MRTRFATVAALLALLLTTAPAGAITKGGVDDGTDHPMVGQLIFYVPDALPSLYGDEHPGGWFTCSGTLVSPTVVVTAGHCTFAIGLDSESTTSEDNRTTAEDGNGSGGNDVWFTTVPDGSQWDGWPENFDANGDLTFPTQEARYAARSGFLEASPDWVRGTSFPHPEYDDNAFYLHDAGVIELDVAQPGPYATVAEEGWLDQYAGRRNEHRFEVVGYGLRREHPKFEEEGDTRMRAEPKLNNFTSNPKNTYIVLSNNPSTGGTCFGDSGGPTFDEPGSLLLVGVTSFGNSPNCTGNGGAYRLDQDDDLDFLAEHGITP